ncbi:hypothetical protein PAXRUDRAFT_220975 [Paxillus rubicundulus Ve08.2h10]|uniref:Uncharacterized protein n=1 Tax=Paxillus rubicundulus Ve08.2h10 TaxID=930991 RepID=A0A0D0DH84_9AGAM|nr:hypothetical protein PAXRUDRAFT_220975 [Paxillus rubicundulus Ve08.2h10]
MAELVHLTGESALAFLLIHDPEEAQYLGLHIPLKSKHLGQTVDFELVHDTPGFLTVQTTKPSPLEQTIIVNVPERGLVFEHHGPFDYPGAYPYPLQDCTNKPGTLYVRGEYPPPGQSGFNAQQFPQYPLKGDVGPPRATSVAGRVVIDFWNQQRITAVVRILQVSAVIQGADKIPLSLVQE